jgi:hypothetical protein
MKALALLVLLAAAGARADDGVRLEARARRGWLTGVGLSLGAVGAVALSFAAYQASMAEASAKGVAAYYSNGTAPSAREASLVGWMQDRSARASERWVRPSAGWISAISHGRISRRPGDRPVCVWVW